MLCFTKGSRWLTVFRVVWFRGGPTCVGFGLGLGRAEGLGSKRSALAQASRRFLGSTAPAQSYGKPKGSSDRKRLGSAGSQHERAIGHINPRFSSMLWARGVQHREAQCGETLKRTFSCSGIPTFIDKSARSVGRRWILVWRTPGGRDGEARSRDVVAFQPDEDYEVVHVCFCWMGTFSCFYTESSFRGGDGRGYRIGVACHVRCSGSIALGSSTELHQVQVPQLDAGQTCPCGQSILARVRVAV